MHDEQPSVRKTCNGSPVRSLDGAVEMYKRGMPITSIALALGFRSGTRVNEPTANGCKRIRRFLEAAGVKK